MTRRHTTRRRRAAAVALALLGVLGTLEALVAPAGARLLLTREAGIARIFGDSARTEARTIYLERATLDSLARRARAPMAQARVTFYAVQVADSLVGLAFVERHVVRTATETVLIALDRDGSVRAVEILAWNEPDDYRPTGRWLETARGVRDASAVRPGTAVPRIAGATLSGRAITAAIRRALVLGEYARTRQH